MARLFDMDFNDVALYSRDFSGEAYGPDSRQFKLKIDDPELVQQLLNDGVNLWEAKKQNDIDPSDWYMTVKVSYKFGCPDVALVTPDGTPIMLYEHSIGDLDSAFIKKADLHVHGSSWERRGNSGVTVYLDTLVAFLMTDEEREEIKSNLRNRSNPIRDKYKDMFGE